MTTRVTNGLSPSSAPQADGPGQGRATFEQRRVVKGQMGEVEREQAREGLAFDDLARGSAARALRVQDEPAGVLVEAQQRHAGSLLGASPFVVSRHYHATGARAAAAAKATGRRERNGGGAGGGQARRRRPRPTASGGEVRRREVPVDQAVPQGLHEVGPAVL